jgi:hypothetical protein
MVTRLLVRSSLATMIAAAAPPAHAGIWVWGCKGTFGDYQVISNREALVVMPKTWLQGSVRNLINGDLATFYATDVNSGLQQTMEYRHAVYPEQNLILTEKSSKTTFSRTNHVRTREQTTMTYRKTYRYDRKGETPRDIQMECVEYMLSAP